MLTKLYHKIKGWLQFFVEKPTAQGDWKWTRENGNHCGTQSINQDSRRYLPYQLNYFINLSKSSVSSDNIWQNAKLIHLSNSLAKTDFLDSSAISTSKTED